MQIITGISTSVAALVFVLSWAGLRSLKRVMVGSAVASHREGRARLKAWLTSLLNTVQPPALIRQRWTAETSLERLRQAGLRWTAAQFAAVRWLGLLCGAGLAVGVIVQQGPGPLSAFFALATGAAGLYGVDFWLARRLEHERISVDLALPDFLDHLRLALEAGLGFEIALQRTSAGLEGRLGAELRRTVRQLFRGQSKRTVLKTLGNRTPSVDLRSFATAVNQAERLGTSLADSLSIQARLLRARRRRRAQEASRRLPVLVVFPLVFFFLPALLIVYLAPPLLQLLLFR